MVILRGLLGLNSTSKTSISISGLPFQEGGACRCGLGGVVTQDLQFFEALSRSQELDRRYYTFVKAENSPKLQGEAAF